MTARNPRTALADAKIRVAQLKRDLNAARIAEAEAEIDLARAELAERAPTTRPPPPPAASEPELEIVDGDWT
jgi:hypothetical protein